MKTQIEWNKASLVLPEVNKQVLIIRKSGEISFAQRALFFTFTGRRVTVFDEVLDRQTSAEWVLSNSTFEKYISDVLFWSVMPTFEDVEKWL